MDATEARELARAAGRFFAQQRRRVPRACAICGAAIEGLTTRRYCSNACRQRAKRQRQAAARPPTAPPDR